MKLKLLLTGLAISLVLSACSYDDDSVMTDNGGQNGAPYPQIEVKNFNECVAAGNPVMEGYPRQCAHDGQTFVEEVVPSPSNENLGETPHQACTKEFKPVCGEVEVQCVRAPCPPIKTTFENRCLAEKEKAQNIVEGECVDETPNPEGACLSFDGNWLDQSQECEGMSQNQCETLGGEYNECASACRNNPEVEVCTMQCVQVCQF